MLYVVDSDTQGSGIVYIVKCIKIEIRYLKLL